MMKPPRASFQNLPLATVLVALSGAAVAESDSHPDLLSINGGHQCAVANASTVRCWGSNEDGQTGVAAGGSRVISPSTPVAGLGSVISVGTGALYSCALTRNLSNPVFCWGSNLHGTLGQPASVSSSATPYAIQGLRSVKALSVGTNFACAIEGDARNVYCWGYLFYANTPSPKLIRGMAGAIAVSTNGQHVCAVIANGRVKCWGDNSYGQMGYKGSSVVLDSIAIADVTDAVSISAGVGTTCVVLKSRRVRCWGDNSAGQIGNGAVIDTSRLIPITGDGHATPPTDVLGITNAVAVSVGYQGACALLSDGSVRCWGAALAQEGTADLSGPLPVLVSSTPKPVNLGAKATWVKAGEHGGCAVLETTAVYCWSYYGSLVGSAANVVPRVPTQVAGLTIARSCGSPECNDADKVLEWAEDQVPDLLLPPRAASISINGVYYRYYAASNAYLGITTTVPEQLVYLGALSGGQPLFLGPLAQWKQKANSP